MHARLLLLTFALAALVSPVLRQPALAQTPAEASSIDRAAAAFASDPVYVDPAAEPGLDAGEAERLRARIEASDAGPIYIAVLPEEARTEAGSIDAALRLLYERAGRPGTYAVVIGEQLRAGSDTFPAGTASALADEAVKARAGEGAGSVLLNFVARLGERASADGESSGEGGGFPGFGVFLVIVLLFAGGAFLLSQRRRRKREQQELEEVREAALDDLVALGDDLRALDLDVEMPGADPAAKRDYERALAAYEAATGALDRARRLEDLREVTSSLEEGRYAMASAKARLDGREPPERRAPCFFDPRHGPSVTDVEWSPDGRAPRLVPVCAADAERIEQGRDPMAREITVGDRRMPYWDAPPYYGPWAGGYYGGFGFGGLFEGMLIGTLLSGGLGFGGFHDAGGGEAGSDSGDFGGGDFGGGDFGGDFGGGDFGGGDFGGGE